MNYVVVVVVAIIHNTITRRELEKETSFTTM